MNQQQNFKNLIPREDLAIGILTAENIDFTKQQSLLNDRLDSLLEIRSQNGLNQQEELFRKESRNILRNGRYSPTGRGKPASEYLLRSAQNRQFPRINSVVDINNYLSLKYMAPVSVWDTDLASSNEYYFRLGKEEESYIFNSAGQELKLKDLICGVAKNDCFNQVKGQPNERPIVTPIKDCLATKTNDKTKNIALAVYFPLKAADQSHLKDIIEESRELFIEIGAGPINCFYI